MTRSFGSETHTRAEERVVDPGLSVSLHDIVALWREAMLARSGTHIHQPLQRGVYPVAPRLQWENKRQVSTDCQILRLEQTRVLQKAMKGV